MNKYCKFLEDIYDDDKLVFAKEQEYLITYDNDEAYIFGNYINPQGGPYAISKEYEGVKFVVVANLIS